MHILKGIKKRFCDNKSLILLILILVLAYMYLCINNMAFIELEVQSDTDTIFKIYWADKNEAYSEQQSSSVRIKPQKSRYNLCLTDLKHVEKLRIDPADQASKIHIKSIVIKQIGYEPIIFKTYEEFKRLSLLYGIQKIDYRQNGLVIISSGIDPQLEVSITPYLKIKYTTYGLKILKLLVITILLIVLFCCSNILQNNFNFVPYCMIFILALIISMAVISKYNQHPDEHVHTKAAIYYHDHWLPPAICASGTEHNYSAYGYSRLDTYEIVYFFAGKFSRLISFLGLKEHIELRLFNILLYFILLLICVRNVEYRIVSIPLLLSPQIWYVFSYFNSDAFSLFIIFIISYQILTTKSRLNNYLQETDSKLVILYAIIFGLLFSTLFLIKKNFYIFVIFLTGYIILKLYYKEFKIPILAIKRLGLIIFIACLLIGLRYSIDIYINGFDRAEKMLECTEKMARSDFKPSTPLKYKYYGLFPKSRGVSLRQMFEKYQWGDISFRSTFGVYGYMSIHASIIYYKLMGIIAALFIAYFVFSFLLRLGIKESMFMSIVLGCSLLLIGLSFWRSWTLDFQAQGRYFLPIFTMFSFLLFRSDKYLNKRITNFFIILMFIISSYSFIFIGLINIPKY